MVSLSLELDHPDGVARLKADHRRETIPASEAWLRPLSA